MPWLLLDLTFYSILNCMLIEVLKFDMSSLDKSATFIDDVIALEISFPS